MVCATRNAHQSVPRRCMSSACIWPAALQRESQPLFAPHQLMSMPPATILDIITLLAEAGADPNQKLPDGGTACYALFLAAGCGDHKLVRLLLSKGANVNSGIDAAKYTWRVSPQCVLMSCLTAGCCYIPCSTSPIHVCSISSPVHMCTQLKVQSRLPTY